MNLRVLFWSWLIAFVLVGGARLHQCKHADLSLADSRVHASLDTDLDDDGMSPGPITSAHHDQSSQNFDLAPVLVVSLPPAPPSRLGGEQQLGHGVSPLSSLFRPPRLALL